MYLLDSDVLIDAKRDYYPLDRVPEFWDWLILRGRAGYVKIPREMYDEIMKGNDDLKDWLKENRDTLLLDEFAPHQLVTLVTEQGYADNLTDAEVESMGNDPFIIAYALLDARGRCVVTTEHSKPKKTRANRHIPDVCEDFDVDCIDTFELIRRLDFRTNW